MQLKDQQRVHQAVNYVLANIAAPLSIAEVANHVHLSAFHFHRVFKRITNEPFNQFVRRKRLEKAFHSLLRYHQPSITDVSECCGFSSPANFSKAFQAYFGFSASQHRQGALGINSKNGKLFSKYGKEISPALLYNGSLSEQESEQVKAQIKRIEVVSLPATHYGVIASTQGYAIEGIMDAWSQMREWLAFNHIAIEPGKTAGFCFDNVWLTPIEVCRYESGYEIADIDMAKQAGMCVRAQAEGRYLLIEYDGKMSDMQTFYLWLLSEYFPQTRLTITYEYVIERYLEINYEQDIMKLEVLVKVH
ncbi:AraC family transcriptional regulator [Motilimonas cestriensis]|uniref:AraC family transcriptional regulator n=1 Tax=Motilimonas cestriensis TaxID=2742685 RepID=A0ABS8WCW2_9GAMM|nr:AraC family transcriptional regulator [Motilimonas cestriensis]MCE2595962.1 AraC family transcriptional regulator [Motilimonas cestriensis]